MLCRECYLPLLAHRVLPLCVARNQCEGTRTHAPPSLPPRNAPTFFFFFFLSFFSAGAASLPGVS
jgi:hypothetical protein